MAASWNWTPESKLCFVTTGATAPFTALIESVLHTTSLDALLKLGFTHLLVQYGTAKDVYNRSAESARLHLQQSREKQSMVIDGIDFDSEGLQAQFRLVQQSNGLIISHAGTTSRMIFVFEAHLTYLQDPAPYWKRCVIRYH
jgi:beta-1,4-N-acetylglucosaminyltransferase